MKLTIVQPYNKYVEEIADLTLPNIEKYCKIHGFQLERPQIPLLEPPFCYKAKFNEVIKYIPQEDNHWIWALDLDSFILDYNITPFSFLSNKPFHICHAMPNPKYLWEINGGSFIFNNKVDFTEVLKQLETTNSDQGAIWEAIARTNFRDQVEVYPYDKFNHHGKFVHHFCTDKKLHKMKERCIREDYLNKFACCFRGLSNKYHYHNYHLIYSRFENLWQNPSILEVGSTLESVKALSMFFNSTDIESVDIIGSPTYKTDIFNWTPKRDYTIVIDDCAHTFEQQKHIYEKLKDHCELYIVEDIDNDDSRQYFSNKGFFLHNTRPEVHNSTIGFKLHER